MKFDAAPSIGWRELRAAAGQQRPLVADEERGMAGVVSGLLWLLGGVTLVAIMFFPGVPHTHRPVLVLLAAIALAVGIVSVGAIDWVTVPLWFFTLSSGASIAVVALTVTATGGALSPAWIYFFFSALFICYFYPPRVALLWLVVCALAHGLPVLYDHRALHAVFLAQWLLASAVYIVLGSALISGKAMMWTHRRRAERLAAQHAAMRAIATATVSGDSEAHIYALVAQEVAELIGGGAAGIMRLDTAESMTVMGSWADHPEGRYAPGTVVAVTPGSDVAEALHTGRPARVDAHPPGSPVDRLGYRSSIVAPIHVGGRIWGILAVTAAQAAMLTVDDERRLTEFGDLLATAVTSLDDRARLADQASSDPLTGLANHRVLHAELEELVRHAGELGEPLAVVVLDIDHFKQINDIGGHELGDDTLVRVAGCLRRLAAEGDILSRAGGDEFTWVIAGAGSEQARELVQAARALIGATVARPYRVTLSAGICDTTLTSDPDELIRLADGALYWSKAHGRDQCQIYDPAVIDELSAHERADRLERSQALVGLRALARAIDAKDPATREHSERVAAFAGRLAQAAGWSEERVGLLREAALVHDVGKIGVTDAILRKPERLTAEERAHVNEHAELSARIVEGVLTGEQVSWIRTHHERPDGAGYPLGLSGDEIPEGGGLLAVADAFDVMTVGRAYSPRRNIAEALEECRALAGRHFSPSAVAALERLDRDAYFMEEEIAGLIPVLGR